MLVLAYIFLGEAHEVVPLVLPVFRVNLLLGLRSLELPSAVELTAMLVLESDKFTQNVHVLGLSIGHE